MKGHFYNYWKVYAWGLLIAILSCLPADNKDTGWINFQHADKVIHFLFYGIFSVLIILALTTKTNNRLITLNKVVLSFFLVLILGALLEIIQHYLIISRTGDPLDMVFNLSGWVVATIVLHLVTYFSSKEPGIKD